MNPQIQDISAKARYFASQHNWQVVSELAKDILKIDHEEPEGFFLKGLSHSAQQEFAKAAEAFQHALDFNSERYDAAIELAGVLSASKKNNEAYTLLESYRHKLDNSPRYLDHAATTYINIGLPEKAVELYEKANRLQPEIDLFKANLASCYTYLGKTAEAEHIYFELVNKNPAHQRNHYMLSRLRTFNDRRHLEIMLSYKKKSALPPSNAIYLLNAIGKEYEDLGEWDLAFEHYKLAGDAATAVSRYNIDEDRQIINTAIKTYDKTWFDSTAIATTPVSPTPIFIVSLPRTGSTLTERIIASHSQVSSLGETQFLPKNVRQVSGIADANQISPEILQGAANGDPEDIATGYMQDIKYRLRSKPYFIEKLPYNFLYIGLISKAFPNAKIIYVERDPVDVCFAMYKQIFTWAYKFSYDLSNLATYYNLHRNLLTHWHEMMPGKIVTVNYDTLVAEPELTVRKLLKNIGLDFEQQCLDFHNNKSPSTTASATQIRSKIHSNSVRKWKKFEKHLTPLIEGLL